MLFTSHLFIFVALPAIGLFVFASSGLLGKRSGTVAMVLASLAFYQLSSHAQLPVLLATLLVNHLLATAILHAERKAVKSLLTACGVAANLAALGYYKYGTFVVTQVESLQHAFREKLAGAHLPLHQWVPFIQAYHELYPWGYAGKIIVLPLAISFFTFQQIAYLVDVREGRVKQHRFLDYAFCVTFFPHLIAGPIVNYRELLPQLGRGRILRARWSNLWTGMAFFIFGLAKKTILADTLADLANPVFDGAGALAGQTFVTAWIGALAYTFQIYFDFSGYSDMALGLARMFGVKLPVNFASPYQADSIIEFWQRWHISLSSWFRTYLYMYLPMGARIGPLTLPVNVLVTFLLCGLWHGAAWTFIVWGAAHGVLLALNQRWRVRMLSSPAARGMPRWVARPLTFSSVVVLWVVFRAPSVAFAVKMIATMLKPDLAAAAWSALTVRHLLLLPVAVVAFAMPATHEIFCRYRVGILPRGLPRLPAPRIQWRASPTWTLATAALAGVALFYQTDFPAFLYWSF